MVESESPAINQDFGLIRFWYPLISFWGGVPFALKRFWPLQVVSFRQMFGQEEHVGVTQVDSWGMKRLFSYCLRRWLSGAAFPRDS